MHKFTLGQKIRDKVSGLEGIATGRVEYINGCIQYGISGEAKDGKIPDTVFIDQQNLIFVDNGILEELKKEVKPKGGPHSYIK